jgi:predicted esterase
MENARPCQGNAVIERAIAAGTHGRYVVAPPARPGPAPMLVGFHGYAEPAEQQAARLQAIPGADRWLIVSIQGLNRFYFRRNNEVVAGWMTRQDRELAIADNIAYVAAVVDAASREWPTTSTLIFTGFSQGVAMTFRAAVASKRPVSGVIAVGGDVPPELEAAALGRISRALVCRGAADDWYTDEIFEKDLRRLRAAGVRVRPLDFSGGHEWNDEVIQAAEEFLREHLA